MIIRMKAIPLLCLFFTPSAFAETLQCRADFDESSHYELSAEVHPRTESSPASFRYVTEDGIDLRASLVASSEAIVPGQTVSIVAANENMGATVHAAFDAATKSYRGTMLVTFDLQQADPVELDASCTVQ